MKTSSQKKLHEGLAKKRSAFPDKTAKLSGESVDARATRKGTAPTPKSLGPRKTGM